MLDALTATQHAMELDQLKLQSISQNIANMNTPGFKKQILEYEAFDEHLQKPIDSVINQVKTNPLTTQGTFTQTNNPTDMAISGEGYFQVQGQSGTYYTRRGDFQINEHGELATITGEILLGKGGPIRVDDNAFTITPQGEVFIEHQKTDEIYLVNLKQQASVHNLGNGLYQSDESPLPTTKTTRVLQGIIEQSNVKSVDEMMDMIKTARHFEASQQVLKAADHLMYSAINQLGENNV